MSTARTPKQERIPPDRLAEAGVWIARLHGDERNPAMEAGFREWLKAHPLNERAFELTTDVWEDSQNLRRVVPFAHEVAKPRARRFRILSAPSMAWAGAAALVLAFVAALLWWPGEVSTDVGEQRLMVLGDGSRIFLNTSTRIAVRYSERTRLVELEAGEALFDVAKAVDRPFVVQVGDRQVRALGTSFVVRRDDTQLAVTLVEGKVAVTQGQGADAVELPGPVAATGSARKDTANSTKVFTLIPGQRLVIPANQPAKVDTQSVEKATAWRRGQVILDDSSLATAVAEMNRYNSRKLVVERLEAGHLIVNGLFQAGDSMSFANAVAQTYELKIIERPNEIVLAGAPHPQSSGTRAGPTR